MTPRKTKNIKVNIPATAHRKRTSTTLSYVICDFFFGGIVNLELRMKLTDDEYRSWLESKAQKWVDSLDYSFMPNWFLETLLLQLIRDHSYDEGLQKNKHNLGLDL